MYFDSLHGQVRIGGHTDAYQSGPMYITGNVNNYNQVIIRNKNSGSSASSDLVFNNDQDSTHYFNMGVITARHTERVQRNMERWQVYL